MPLLHRTLAFLHTHGGPVRAALLVTAMLLLGDPSFAADLGVQPTAVLLDARRDRGTVVVTNHGREAVTVQADAQGWQRVDGRDVEEPTAQLRINPPLFTLPAGGTQVVRLGLRQPAEADRETLYRLVLRELPPQAGSGAGTLSGQVRVLVTLRLPVYVAPRQPRAEARWSLERAADGQLVARVTNTGNQHLRLAGVRLVDGGATTLATHGPMAPLFPGESRGLPLAGTPPAPGRPLRLELRTLDEVHHVDVALAAR